MAADNKKPDVLIIDDDKFLLDMYILKFKERGFVPEACLSAGEALTKLAEGLVPHIILLDIVMPGMDGFEFLKEIKQRKLVSSAKIIILSNLGQREDIDRGMELGADGYIIKASATPTEVVNQVLEIAGK